MKIRYFLDTDTALIEFSNVPVVETKEISENLYIDLDEKGNIVSMTIEHAKEKAGISEVSFFLANGKGKCLTNQSTRRDIATPVISAIGPHNQVPW